MNTPAPNTHRVHVRVVVLGAALVLYDGLEVRQTIPNLKYLLKLLIVFDDDEVTVGVVGDVVTRFRRVGRVDARRKAASENDRVMTLK